MSEIVLAEPASRDARGPGTWYVVKRLRADALTDEEAVGALRREIELAARLPHPRLPRVLERRTEASSPWMTMEYIDGPDLGRFLLELGKRGKRLDLRSVHCIITGVLDALRFLHEQAGNTLGGGAQGRPVLHNAVGPQNVLLGTHGDVRLADLGHAWFAGRGQPKARTTVGMMASLTPEALRDQPVSVRTDLFLLGNLMYECLTGRHPFLRDSVQETAREVGRCEPRPLDSLRPVPPELSAIVHRCLAREPEARPDSLEELEEAVSGLRMPGWEEGTRMLVKELRAVFPEHNDASRPWLLRGRGFHPSFLPTVSPWLPAPTSTLELMTPPSIEGRKVSLAYLSIPDEIHDEWSQPITPAPPDWEPRSHPQWGSDDREDESIAPVPWEEPPPPPPVAAPVPEPPAQDPPLAPPPRPPSSPAIEAPSPSEPAPAPSPVPLPLVAAGLAILLAGVAVALFAPRAPSTVAPSGVGEPAAPVSAPSPASVADAVEVRVTTEPPGAEVSVDGEILGLSPVDLVRAPGTLLQVQVRLAAEPAQARLFTVPSDGGTLRFQLEPAER